MPSYKRPGIYVSEDLNPLSMTASTSGGSSAAFVGHIKQGGPTKPTLVSTWNQYLQIFGGFGDGSDLLPFAVYEYFNNGGSGCYVVRGVNASAVSATAILQDGESTPANVLTVTAISPGAWGNNITVDVVPGTAGNFDLTVNYNGITERYADVTLDPTSPRYLPPLINSSVSGSALVNVSYTGPSPWTSINVPAAVTASPLATGSDGTGSPDLVAAAEQLSNLTGTFDINLPGVNDNTTINALVSWAENDGRYFLVVDGVADPAAGSTESANATAQTALLTGGSALSASSALALYAPWVLADDPSSSVPGAQRALPPGGFILGQYARTDINRGPQKVAAGIDTPLRGVIAPQQRYSAASLDALSAAQVNAIKVLPGYGSVIFGGRTTKPGMPDRYINIRRSLIRIKEDLKNLCQFALFEVNDDALRGRLRDVTNQYLQSQWQVGMLSGSSVDEAFNVVCDSSNNTPSTVQEGLVNVTIGVALSSPAEFIVFTIGLSQTGATITNA
jgi:hypothetical protein